MAGHLNQPQPIGPGRAAAGLGQGLVQGLPGAFGPAQAARSERIALLSGLVGQQVSARARAAAGGGRARPPQTITGRLQATTTKLKGFEGLLKDLRDPSKQEFVLKSQGFEDSEQFPEAIKELRTQFQTGQQAQLKNAVFGDTFRNASVDPTIPPGDFSRGVVILQKLSNGDLKDFFGKDFSIPITSTDPLQAVRDYNAGFKVAIRGLNKFVDGLDLNDRVKEMIKEGGKIFIAERTLPSRFVGERPTAPAIPLERGRDFGAAIIRTQKPKTTAEWIKSVRAAIRPQLEAEIEEGNIGFFDKRAFNDFIKDTFTGALDVQNPFVSGRGAALDAASTAFIASTGGRFESQVTDPVKRANLAKLHGAVLGARREFIGSLEEFKRRAQREADRLLLQGAQRTGRPLLLPEEVTGELEFPEDISALPGEIQPGEELPLEEPGAVAAAGLLPGAPVAAGLPGLGALGAVAELGAVGALPGAELAPPVEEREPAFVTAARRATPPPVAPGVPREVMEVSNALIGDSALTPEQRDFFAEMVAGSFEPEDLSELSAELGIPPRIETL